jgi:hypothetical protein
MAGLDPAIHVFVAWMRGSSPRMTMGRGSAPDFSIRHCEERSDQAIQPAIAARPVWIASRSLSSGGAFGADPLARNDDVG